MALHNMVAIGGRLNLIDWIVLTLLLLHPRNQLRGRDTGKTGTKVTVALERIHKNDSLPSFAWLLEMFLPFVFCLARST